MSDKQLADNLRAAKALIDTPAKWTQGCLARIRGGEMNNVQVGIGDPDANCFCTMGAAIKFCVDAVGGGFVDYDTSAYNIVRRPMFAVLDAASKALTGDDKMSMVKYNDGVLRTHEEVMGLWDKAIEMAEAEPDAV